MIAIFLSLKFPLSIIESHFADYDVSWSFFLEGQIQN